MGCCMPCFKTCLVEEYYYVEIPVKPGATRKHDLASSDLRSNSQGAPIIKGHGQKTSPAGSYNMGLVRRQVNTGGKSGLPTVSENAMSFSQVCRDINLQ